jgi:hypothetical protein
MQEAPGDGYITGMIYVCSKRLIFKGMIYNKEAGSKIF